MNLDDHISPHFTFGELTRTDARHLLDRNRDVPEDLLLRAKALCLNLLEPLREHFGSPVVIHSGYRCEALNTMIGGTIQSQHLHFEAADFHVVGVTLQTVFDWVWRESGLPFGQVILEGATRGVPTWLHLSLGEPWRPSKNRQAMLFDGKRYTEVVA